MVRPVIRVAPYDDGGGGFGPVAFGDPKAGGGSSAGRRLMSKVPSLVFDMDMEGGEGGAPAARGAAPLEETAELQDVLARIHALTEPWGEAEYMVRRVGGFGELRL